MIMKLGHLRYKDKLMIWEEKNKNTKDKSSNINKISKGSNKSIEKH